MHNNKITVTLPNVIKRTFRFAYYPSDPSMLNGYPLDTICQEMSPDFSLCYGLVSQEFFGIQMIHVNSQ